MKGFLGVSCRPNKQIVKLMMAAWHVLKMEYQQQFCHSSQVSVKCYKKSIRNNIIKWIKNSNENVTEHQTDNNINFWYPSYQHCNCSYRHSNTYNLLYISTCQNCFSNVFTQKGGYFNRQFSTTSVSQPIPDFASTISGYLPTFKCMLNIFYCRISVSQIIHQMY